MQTEIDFDNVRTAYLPKTSTATTHYFNTNKESGTTLQNSEEKALSQEEKIKNFFLTLRNRDYKIGEYFNAETLHHSLFDTKTPLTSVRRAITNLCSAKHDHFLVKTDKTELGMYGKQIHIYKVR